jgi:leucyl-tRNA synthetase
MSKSLKNVINPDEIIRDYGADSMRLYEMFMGPLQVSKPWSTSGLAGVHRFLDRIWRLSERKLTDGKPDKELEKLLHKTIKKVTRDTESLEFNTAIAQMMIFVNEMFKQEDLNINLWKPFVLLLAPYAAHLAEELWEQLGEPPSISSHGWPTWDEQLTKDEEKTVVVQINGKVRSKLLIAAGTPKEELEKLAFENERIREWIEGKTVRRVIVVVDKLVNIVVS